MIAAKVEMLKVAWPIPLRGVVPSRVLPSLNVTEPAGVPPPDVTVALKVTFWPSTEGFVLEVTVVTVPAWLTVCTKGGDETLPEKLAVPP